MKYFFLWVIIIAFNCCHAQKNDGVINAKEVERIETVLAADEMEGRKAGTPGIDKAAQFIADEFKKAGIQPFKNDNFLQAFTMVRPKQVSAKVEVDDVELDSKNVVIVTTQSDVKVNEKSGYEIKYINSGQNLNTNVQTIIREKKNAIVFVDTSFTRNFARLNGLKRQSFKTDNTVVFILGSYKPKEFTVKAEHTMEETTLANVVGIIPGKSKPNEYVIFSAHHDHVGIGKPVNGDSIYNGANDDAAGTTAVIMLAKHFKTLNNNERTIVFATFTAEESGGFGSQYFSQQYDAKDVVAMFNIEMIGTESKWGKNTAFITGYDVTDMSKIMQKNLEGTAFTFHPDPYPDQQLFYRSDNATLARLGVPAHTISTAKMENEPHYHKPSDEVKTLDLNNMAEIIKAIAQSSKTIISGKDTPIRVKVEDLR